jgi:hypothetical protein
MGNLPYIDLGHETQMTAQITLRKVLVPRVAARRSGPNDKP